ncbi:hypothetical protein LHYA1_G004045 [Lachnellula hyalina]|uniref:Uncharacterized protein n=1 Tax=Lachnellula hyalina TaxID=1316788 RepID=A0A8H8U0Q7_9HELO|nr:uncharacterized protein LHYA1_G004045 [Lachnellula hyalina]TVY27580.1 hypothetical protein LHYA1_G004045 [Lachnellula hyalina]
MGSLEKAFKPLEQRRHNILRYCGVSQEIALKYLSSYLTATATKAHLLPNARLEASGPTAGSSSSVTLHNLQRVEAGLRGEWLAPTLQLNEGDGEGGDEEIAGQGMDDGTAVGAAEEGWQDLEEYQREQSIEVGNVGGRDTSRTVELGKDEEVEVAEDDSEVDVEAPKAKKVKTMHKPADKVAKSVDKDARKKEKKARQLEEKKQRTAEKLKKAEA